MYKITCLVLCVVAASLSSFHVRADSLTFRDIVKTYSEACLKEHPGMNTSVINEAAETGNPNIVHPCFSGCVFKKIGFINDKGEYDTNSALTNLRKLVTDDKQYAQLAEVARQCTSVKDTATDGEAGCERGSRLSACFLQQKDNAESDNSDSVEDFDAFRHECMKEFGVTDDDLASVVKSNDVAKIDSCYWGCYFSGMGLLDEKGQYDLNNFEITMRQMLKEDEVSYTRFEKLGKICEPVRDETVSDGEAGCERGALLAACFLKNDQMH